MFTQWSFTIKEINKKYKRQNIYELDAIYKSVLKMYK